MRIINIILGIACLSMPFAMSAQNIFDKINTSELSQLQEKLMQDYCKENISTVEVYRIQEQAFDNTRLSFSYENTLFKFEGSKRQIENQEAFYWEGIDVVNNAKISLFNYNGKVTGAFTHLEISHEIQDLENAVIIYRTPEFQIELNDQLIPEEGAASESTTHSLLAGEAECKVRVLVAYSNQANIPGRDFHFYAEARMNDLNTQFNNSAIGHQAELACVAHLNYNEPTVIDYPGCTSVQCEAVYELQANANLIALRNLYDADIVMVVLNQGSGIAFREPSSEWAFGAISWDNFTIASAKTFSHELGHTYGCYHNTEESPIVGNSKHGYNADLDGAANWRTILSYQSGCGCSRIDHFSNPNEYVGGVPTGSNPNVHNCAGKINDRASDVADFRLSQDNKIITADNLNNTDDYVYVYGHETINTSGNYTVGNGAVARFRATDCVGLSNGFKVSNGGQFQIYNGSCGNNIPGIIAETEERTIPTNTGEEMAQTDLKISPNPLSSHANIEFYNTKARNVSLFISDVEGKLIRSILDNEWQDKGMINFTLTNDIGLKGMYFCTIVYEDQYIQKKFIVLK